MIRLFLNTFIVFCIIITSFVFSGCKKNEDPIKYLLGTFPESVINLEGINSSDDDYNMNLPQLFGMMPVIFSSNRGSSEGQFDLFQGLIQFTFDQINGNFSIHTEMTSDPFYNSIFSKANTMENELGPYSFFSSLDGFEYFLYSSVNGEGDLDYYYLKYLPYFGTVLPLINGPFPLTLLNTSSDEAYICLNNRKDTIYFSSDRDGSFRIYSHAMPPGTTQEAWFNLNHAPSVPVESLISEGETKCSYVHKNIMVFSSNRPGGNGGYDLYYSLLRGGEWSSPVNFGPGINTPSDEYRPVLGTYPGFTNHFIIFSSDRPGGKGGFDLYLTGMEFPDK
jgi:hypothetical protein